jgi:HSP20 family protein
MKYRLETLPLAGLHQELDQLLRHTFAAPAAPVRTTAGFAPALDVVESDDAYLVSVDLPGVAASEVEITFEGGLLTVAGERQAGRAGSEGEDEGDGERVTRRERRFGRFSRSIRLSEPVSADAVSATARDGVVTVTVPKAEEAKPRRVTVTAA